MLLCSVVLSDALGAYAEYDSDVIEQPNNNSANIRLHRLSEAVSSMRATGNSAAFHGTERRGNLRVEIPFPATALGVDADGEDFQIDAVLDNLSACGLYLRLPLHISAGTKLFMIVCLTSDVTLTATAPRVAFDGVVVRAEQHPTGLCGLAIEFTHHRFIYTS